MFAALSECRFACMQVHQLLQHFVSFPQIMLCTARWEGLKDATSILCVCDASVYNQKTHTLLTFHGLWRLGYSPAQQQHCDLLSNVTEHFQAGSGRI